MIENNDGKHTTNQPTADQQLAAHNDAEVSKALHLYEALKDVMGDMSVEDVVEAVDIYKDLPVLADGERWNPTKPVVAFDGSIIKPMHSDEYDFLSPDGKNFKAKVWQKYMLFTDRQKANEQRKKHEGDESSYRAEAQKAGA